MKDQRLPSLIDRWLGPRARLLQRHDVSVAAPPDRTYEAVQQATLRNMPVVRLLFALRRIPHSREMTLREFFTTPPFLILEEDPPHEIVIGVAGRPWRLRTGGARRVAPTTPAEFRAFAEEGATRVIANSRVEATSNGSCLSTETWVETFGPAARRWFAVYWLVIGPFSALTRREFLRAARRAAEE